MIKLSSREYYLEYQVAQATDPLGEKMSESTSPLDAINLSAQEQAPLGRYVTHIDHLGIAVPSLKEASAVYETLLGGAVDHTEEVADQKVKTAFFQVGESAFELLEATDPQSPIAHFLERNPRGGIHHVCVGVSDIEAVLRRYREAGVRLIDDQPRRGAHDKWVAFIHPRSTGGVLLELSQSGPLASERAARDEG